MEKRFFFFILILALFILIQYLYSSSQDYLQLLNLFTLVFGTFFTVIKIDFDFNNISTNFILSIQITKDKAIITKTPKFFQYSFVKKSNFQKNIEKILHFTILVDISEKKKRMVIFLIN